MDRSSARERIVKAATELFALQGYKATSMGEVAEVAGTSRSLVFFHFGSKERLLEAVVESMSVRYRTIIAAAIGDQSGLDAVRAMVAARQTVMAARHELARLIYLLIGDAIGWEPSVAAKLADIDDEMRTLFAGWLRDAQVAGQVTSKLDASALATLVLAAFHGNSLQWLLQPERFDVVAADSVVIKMLELLGADL